MTSRDSSLTDFSDLPDVPPAAALQRLREGNERFATGLRSVEAMATQVNRSQLLTGQKPYAVILTCSDSRVPAEILFDCGLGELFVIRVAGNVATAATIDSVEFAIATFDTRLVVVMGHTRCGAIDVAASVVRGEREPPSIARHIIATITPVIRDIVGGPGDVGEAVKANVMATVSRLRENSDLLRPRIDEGSLVVVGAEYALETGRVAFFAPEAEQRHEL